MDLPTSMQGATGLWQPAFTRVYVGEGSSAWWLAVYVMLTRGRRLENLILLGFTEQVEELLRRGPPPYLRQLTGKLEAKAALTFERLRLWPACDGQ